MRALVLRNNKLRVEDITKPVPLEGEALVEVLKTGICNTDLELVKGYMNFEGVLGHEFVGRVVQAPEKKWIGRRVVGEINLFCGKCEICKAGDTKHCPSRDVLGIVKKDGVFAEFMTLPLENLHSLPQNISDIEAVFIEPLAAALEIFEQVRIRKQESVLILGDGKLGLLVAQVMKLKTEEVYCIGKHARKLDLLRKKGIKTFLTDEKFKRKFDVVVEATGNETGLKEALSRVNPKGKIVLKSTYQGAFKIDVSKLVVDEIQLIGSRCGPVPKAIDVLEKKMISIDEMVDGDFPLEKGIEAFAFAQKPGVMKILITP